MPVVDLDDLTKPLTAAEIKEAIYATLSATGVDTTTWKAGAVLRTLIAGVAIIGAALSTLQARIAAGGYLDRATGNWLTILAWYVYRVQRTAATFAAGNVTLDNTGGGDYTIAVGELTVSDPATGAEFQNTAAFTLEPLETGVDVPVQAVVAGSGSTAQAGGISNIVSPSMTGVTCSNATALVGSDEQLDPALRELCLEKLGSFSPNGPADAHAFAAKSAQRSDGSNVGVTRVRSVPDGFGVINVYLATATGGITGTVGDLGTDLGAVDNAIQLQVVPLGYTAAVQSATPLAINVVYTVYCYSSLTLTDAQLTTEISNRLVQYISTRPIGGDRLPGDTGKVFRNRLEAVIGSTRDEIYEVIVTDADISVAASEAPVAGSIVGSIVRVQKV